MNFGAAEFLVIAIFALIVFGPRRLPEIARSVGQAFREFKKSTGDLTREFREGLDDDEHPMRPEPPRPGPR